MPALTRRLGWAPSAPALAASQAGAAVSGVWVPETHPHVMRRAGIRVGGRQRGREFAAEFADAVAALPQPIRLILDDVHELLDADGLHGVALLTRIKSAGVQVVLSAGTTHTRVHPIR